MRLRSLSSRCGEPNGRGNAGIKIYEEGVYHEPTEVELVCRILSFIDDREDKRLNLGPVAKPLFSLDRHLPRVFFSSFYYSYFNHRRRHMPGVSMSQLR